MTVSLINDRECAPEFSGFMDGQSGALLRIGAVSPVGFCENKIYRYQTVTFNKDGLSDLTNIFCSCYWSAVLYPLPPPAEAAVKYVDVDVLHVREDPFEDSPIAFKLKRNESIDELDTLNNWSAFKDPDYPGQTFWVASRLSDQKPETHSLTDKKLRWGSAIEDPWRPPYSRCPPLFWGTGWQNKPPF